MAAVRAAHWTSSERQAMLALVMPVLQRLVTGPGLVAATEVVTGRGPRALIRIDLVGLRLCEHAFLDQVEEGLRVGWMYQRPETRPI